MRWKLVVRVLFLTSFGLDIVFSKSRERRREIREPCSPI